MNQHKKSLLILMLIPALWGLTFPLIKMASTYINAETFVTIRCSLAALTLLPFVFSKLFTLSKQRILQSLLLGILNGANLICQTLGLKTLDPASSAFITGTGIIIVPFLLPLFNLGKLRTRNFIYSILCLIGLYILTGTALKQNLIGILWTLGCAFFYALFVVYLQKIKPEKNEVLILSFYQIIGSLGLASLFTFHTTSPLTLNMITITALIFCGVITTSLILILQTRYQQYIPATQAILIYSLEALFASLFSFLLMGTHLSLKFLFGGLLMISSIILNELPVFKIGRDSRI